MRCETIKVGLARMPERSKGPHSRCGVAKRVGSNPTPCIFYFRSVLKTIVHFKIKEIIKGV